MHANPPTQNAAPARNHAITDPALTPRVGRNTSRLTSSVARLPYSIAWLLGLGFPRPILVRLYERVSNLWLLLTLASGVLAATGLIFESVLVAGIGLATALFGAAHLPAGFGFTGLATLAGLGYGLAFHYSGDRLWVAVFLHAAVNSLHLLLLNYPLR